MIDTRLEQLLLLPNRSCYQSCYQRSQDDSRLDSLGSQESASAKGKQRVTRTTLESFGDCGAIALPDARTETRRLFLSVYLHVLYQQLYLTCETTLSLCALLRFSWPLAVPVCLSHPSRVRRRPTALVSLPSRRPRRGACRMVIR